MHLIAKMRDHLTEKGAAITSKSPWVPKLSYGIHSFQEVDGVQAEWGKGTTIQPTMTLQEQMCRQQIEGRGAKSCW